MSFIKLPVEIHLLIIQKLGPSELGVLMQTGRAMARFLEPEMDREALSYKMPNFGSVLHWAAGRGQIQLAGRLINKGLSASAKNHLDQTPLFPAAAAGDVDMIRSLLSWGTDVEHLDCIMSNALVPAAGSANPAALGILIGALADTSVRNRDRCLNAALLTAMKGPFNEARLHDLERVVHLIVEAGVDIFPYSWGFLVLDTAVDTRSVEVVITLLKAGAVFSAHSRSNVLAIDRAMDLAVSNGSKTLIEMLLSQRANVDFAMERAVSAGNVSILNFISTLSPKEFRRRRRSYVDTAIRSMNPEMVRHLLSCRAKLPSLALHNAAKLGSTEIARALIEWGADVNAQNYDHDKPIFIAADKTNIEMIQLLLSNNAMATDADRRGRTLLHRAITGDLIIRKPEPALSPEDTVLFIDYLVKAGVDINQANDAGQAPLHYALLRVNRNTPAMVSALVGMGADTAIEYLGRTPLQFAFFKKKGLTCRDQALDIYGDVIEVLGGKRPKRKRPRPAAQFRMSAKANPSTSAQNPL